MSTGFEQSSATTVQNRVINDFCITFSTINGSGSATANNTLLRALFKMGIPVSGKNIFPSNIQGQPTWYTIRISKDHYLGRLEKDDIVVAMNPATVEKELEFVLPGGVLFYADDLKFSNSRQDITLYPMPVKKLAKEADVPSNLRDYVANMVYVGVVAHILQIELEKIYQALDFHLKGKKKAVDSNFNIVKAAADWAAENLVKKDPYFVEPMEATKNCIMADGNTAAALGSIYGGVQFVAWYPITPASSLAESLHEYVPILRKDPVTGKETCVIVQAEDELAAIGMAIGAGWGGLRAMTSTSGPGLSLMSEYLGLAYFVEIPVVVWDVQRVGPGTGLPTRTAQQDITYANYLGHGDTQFVILIPSSINECFEFGWKAFDIAERLQTPVLVLSDLDLGMNQWMSEKFEYPNTAIDRGKVLWEEELQKMLERQEKPAWGRYVDIDGDGIPYRTLPGNRHPRSGFFTRGSGHDEYARLSEDPVEWERNLNRLKQKFINFPNLFPKPVLKTKPGARIGMIAYGSADSAVDEAQNLMEEAGLLVDYLRLRCLPLSNEVTDFVKNYERVYVVEINRDGQMNQLLTIAMVEYAKKLISISHVDGLALSARWVRDEILTQEGFNNE